MLSTAIFLVVLVLLIWRSMLPLIHNNGKRQTLPPGPWSLPIIGNLHKLGKHPHRALANLAKKYGPIMSLRLGLVPTIVVSSPPAAELFLKQYDHIFASRPAFEAAAFMSYGAKAMALTPYGDYWRRVRKMCTMHLLSAAKVEEFEGLRRSETEAAVRSLKEAAELHEVVDVGKKVGELIEEITFKMVVGKGRKDDEKRYDLKEVVEEALELVGAFNLADFVPFLAPLDLQGLRRKMKASSKLLDEIFEAIIEDHLSEEDFGQHQDILGAMLALMNKSNDEFMSSFGRDNVKAIMFDLFAGGIDAIALTVTWAFAALLRQPRIMNVLHEELDVCIGKGNMVKESDLPKLVYLDMVIKETLRLYPPGPMLVPHESTEDVIVNGYTIPKRSRIIINLWAIGQDEEIWSKNAKEFYPERFENRNIDIRGTNFTLIPFGSGRRGCPGMQLGLVMVKFILAQLVHCFKWELPGKMKPEDVDMTEKFGLTMPRASELLAIPVCRA